MPNLEFQVDRQPEAPEGYLCWRIQAFEDGVYVGETMLAEGMGCMFGWDMEVVSANANVALALWKRAGRHARERGHKKVCIHMDDDINPRLKQLWLMVGATKVTTLYEVPV